MSDIANNNGYRQGRRRIRDPVAKDHRETGVMGRQIIGSNERRELGARFGVSTDLYAMTI